MMAIRDSIEMKKNGFMVLSFPKSLSNAMKSHIFHFFDIQTANDEENLNKLTQLISSYSDEEFTTKLSKPFRFFPDSIALLGINWVEGLKEQMNARITGINYVCPAERNANPVLHDQSYDIFWRCVRPFKPDVGAAHCDYQFWEIAKGTLEEASSSFDYDERWKIWIPLLGCDMQNSLQVIPASHTQEIPTDIRHTKNGYKPMIQLHWLEKNKMKFVCPLAKSIFLIRRAGINFEN